MSNTEQKEYKYKHEYFSSYDVRSFICGLVGGLLTYNISDSIEFGYAGLYIGSVLCQLYDNKDPRKPIGDKKFYIILASAGGQFIMLSIAYALIIVFWRKFIAV